jgi:hypothetical protein
MTTLRDQFAVIHKKEVQTKSGVIVLDYISWSQVADRLDEVLPDNWSFQIVALGDDWCHGRLRLGERVFENIGYAENAEADWKKEALKDAVSDTLKRCAALAGVGRYLYDKDTPKQPSPAPAVPSHPAQPAAPGGAPPSAGAPHGGWLEGAVHATGHKPLRARANGSLYCPTKLQDGRWCDFSTHARPEPLPGVVEAPAPDWEGIA